MPRQKKGADPYNQRLDIFLTQLHIDQEKKEQILRYVETLTFEALREKKPPSELRLQK